MNIRFRGAALEVGRSCVEVESKDKTFLFDCGVKIVEDGLNYPKGLTTMPNVDAIFLSHAHLDHSGALPLYSHYNLDAPIYCTSCTKAITKILLKDSYKIENTFNHKPLYDETDISKVMNLMTPLNLNRDYFINGFNFKMYDAGHIPGSCSYLVNLEGKKLYYSGDINIIQRHLVKPAELPDTVDILIIESTYGGREHPARKQTEKKFIKSVQKILGRGGLALVPSFGVDRAQELIMVLHEANIHPIYLDGMAIEVTKTLIGKPRYINKYNELKSSFKDTIKIKSNKMRKNIRKGVIVTTSGMLTGGPIMHYLKEYWDDSKSGIILTGYQAEGTNGRLLLEDGAIIIDGVRITPKTSLEKYDFSAHCGYKELKDFVLSLSPSTLILNHGDVEEINEFGNWAKDQKIKVIIPKLGESFTL